MAPRYSNGRFMARHTLEAEQANHLIRRAIGRLDQALFQHRETMAELTRAKPELPPVRLRIEPDYLGHDEYDGNGRPPLNPDQCEL